MVKWTAGWNMPGYLPEMEPEEFDTWHEALAFLVAEVERWSDDGEFLQTHTSLHSAATNPDRALAVPAGNVTMWICESEPMSDDEPDTNEFWQPDTIKEANGDA